jgi:hypothetical protein
MTVPFLAPFSAGQILTSDDMNETAEAVNSLGLFIVKTQTVGSGVSSIVVTNAFSSDYDNYKITYTGGVGSTFQDITMVLGATTSNYYWVDVSSTFATGAVSGTSSNVVSNAYWRVGKLETNGALINMDIINPFKTVRTFYSSSAPFAVTTGAFVVNGGYLNNATSYTGFTLNPIGSTLTGGTIRVYGYRNSYS